MLGGVLQDLGVDVVAEALDQCLAQRVAEQAAQRRQRQAERATERADLDRGDGGLGVPGRLVRVGEELQALSGDVDADLQRDADDLRLQDPHQQLTPPAFQQEPHDRDPGSQPRHAAAERRPGHRDRPGDLGQQFDQ